jgi:hypothetical protein
MHHYVYANKSKIDNLYAQLVDRVEEEYRTHRTTEISGRGSITTGKLVSWLHLPEIGGELSGKKANSTEVVSKLALENKLNIIQTALKKFNECTNLNRNPELSGNLGKFVSFTAKFYLTDRSLNANNINEVEVMELAGIFSNTTIKLIVAKRSFIEPYWGHKLLAVGSAGGGMSLRVFGTLMNLDIGTKIGFVDPVAIHYDYTTPTGPNSP